jgi:septum formation protein
MVEEILNLPIVLASASPRRKQIMEQAGFTNLTISPIDVDEIFPKHLSPEEAVLYLAALKNGGYKKELTEGEVLLTSDTIVTQKGNIIGKPKDKVDATNMLQQLSGEKHTVITAVCLKSTTMKSTFSVSTAVKFKKLKSEEIEYYLNNYEPYDKAGSYGVQEWLGMVAITELKGCFYNVMGLPINTVYKALKKFI